MQRKLTLEQAECFTISAQEAAENARMMHSTEQDAVNFTHQRSQTGKFWPQLDIRGRCGQCGSEKHAEDECTHLRTVCHKCGRRGHLSQMCQSARSSHRQQFPHADVRRQGAYAMTAQDCATSDDSEALYTIEAVLHQESSIRKVKPIYRVVSWDNIPLTMLVDTGSPVSIISATVFWKYETKWTPLQKTQLKLSCLLGELPVLGQLIMTARCDGKDIQGTVIVVDSSGPSLCGRDTIKAFNEIGVSMLTNIVASVQLMK